MKYYIILCIISITCPTIAMQPAQWSQPPQQKELHKEQLSTDWHKIVAGGRTKSEVIQALRSMNISETQINDLIVRLADRYYDKNRIVAAWDLDTQDSIKWFNSAKAKEWFKTYEYKDAHWLKQNFIGSLSKPEKRIYPLLAIGFNPNVKINGRGGYYSPLDVAFDNKDLNLFERLLAAGADPDSMNTEKDMSIVERVALSKNIPFLKALIIANANRNPILNNGQTLIQSLEKHQKDFETTEYNPIIDLLKTGVKPLIQKAKL